ncbi:MAG: helix-turn-helix transcriptional regulator [Saprospiraceae bacterium]|nr:helix-turn-helix transcriptional regulator [Saprospiraceae bacterium]
MQNDYDIGYRKSLSPREHEVLELLSKGLSSTDIAMELFLSNHTIKDHRRSLMEKLQARNVAQMIRRGFELELLLPAI